jgi:hypothetical protein
MDDTEELSILGWFWKGPNNPDDSLFSQSLNNIAWGATGAVIAPIVWPMIKAKFFTPKDVRSERVVGTSQMRTINGGGAFGNDGFNNALLAPSSSYAYMEA